MSRTFQQKMHDRGLRTVRGLLNADEHSVQLMSETRSSFDMLVDGKIRLEVKTATRLQHSPRMIKKSHPPTWKFCLDHHGVVKKNRADIFWLCIYGIPGFKAGISLVIPSKEIKEKRALFITLRSLVTRWGKWYMRTDLFNKSES